MKTSENESNIDLSFELINFSNYQMQLIHVIYLDIFFINYVTHIISQIYLIICLFALKHVASHEIFQKIYFGL